MGDFEKKLDSLGRVLLTRDKLPSILDLAGFFLRLDFWLGSQPCLGTMGCLSTGSDRLRFFLSVAGWDRDRRATLASMGKS